MSAKGVCDLGHLLKENARSFGCPECRRNNMRREQRAQLPRKLAEGLTKGGELWLLGAYPVNKARILARAYLHLLRRTKR